MFVHKKRSTQKKYRFTNSSTDDTEKKTGIWKSYNIVITFNPIDGFSETSYLRLDYSWGKSDKSELYHSLTQNEINEKTYTFTVSDGNISRIEAYGVEVTSVKVKEDGKEYTYTFIDN